MFPYFFNLSPKGDDILNLGSYYGAICAENLHHRSERECEFGHLFYSEVYPQAGEFPPEIRDIVLEIERLHREFHQLACQVTQTCSKKDLQALYKVTDLLIARLMRLEKMVQSKGTEN